jgi:hypothetical protein
MGAMQPAGMFFMPALPKMPAAVDALFTGIRSTAVAALI